MTLEPIYIVSIVRIFTLVEFFLVALISTNCVTNITTIERKHENIRNIQLFIVVKLIYNYHSVVQTYFALFWYHVNVIKYCYFPHLFFLTTANYFRFKTFEMIKEKHSINQYYFITF